MLKDKVGVVQIAAIEALGRFGDRGLAKAIYEMTARSDMDVVKSALVVLGEIGDLNIAQRIQIFLNHEHWGIRAAAAQALGRLGDARARESLAKMAKDDPDRLAQQSAQSALAQFKGAS
jgi:HEAT repeat protein